jgi:hypothetical protein
MKTKLLILVVLLSTQFIIAQNYQTIEEIDDACTQLGFSGDDDAEIIVDNILEKIGLFKNFTIQECPNINNAVAKNIDIGNGRKERFILYDNEFFNKIEDKASNDWAGISILAHEIGHHLNGHSLNNDGSTHQYELEADEFSGFVLARMESTLEDAQSAIKTLRYEKATRTHPAKADRLVAIERGWNRGNGKVIAVKEISDDEKKEIIENNNDDVISSITAEQVIANYLDAIGGQDKISKVKTRRLEALSKYKYIKDGNSVEFESFSRTSFLTPTRRLTEQFKTEDGEITEEKLFYKGGLYERVAGEKKWKWKANSNIEDANLAVSHFIEYSYLVNNIELILEGIELVEGQKCYKINMPKAETIKAEINNYDIYMDASMTNYYSVESGFLIKTVLVTDSNVIADQKTGEEDMEVKHIVETIIETYSEVDGIFFPAKAKSTQETYINTTLSTEMIQNSESTKIEVNPILNKEDFIPNKVKGEK